MHVVPHIKTIFLAEIAVIYHHIGIIAYEYFKKKKRKKKKKKKKKKKNWSIVINLIP